jgi:hypothetical protein
MQALAEDNALIYLTTPKRQLTQLNGRRPDYRQV